MYIDINAQPESSCSCASSKNTPLNGAWQQQGRFIETAFGARCSVQLHSGSCFCDQKLFAQVY